MDQQVFNKKFRMYGDLQKSIEEIRPIFPELTDEQFAGWYSRRCKVTVPLILKILEEIKHEGQVNA